MRRLHSRRLRPDFLRRDDGVALVEMTLVMPVLLLLLVGFVEFGRMLYMHQVVETAARATARFLARAPAIDATTTTAAQNIAIYGNPDGSGTPRLSHWPAEGLTTIGVTGPVAGAVTGTEIVRVVIQLPYKDVGLLGVIGLAPPDLTAAHEERYSGGNG
ncbi:TadE/TadG family type IV pilus assembly protein [Caenispirillum salinarum]|uniref:TadE/TadG family type IV pilus assembly protein n=1 Tax=Caenispirillum salinarum TaxID=859058 RepID=UPI00384F6A78